MNESLTFEAAEFPIIGGNFDTSATLAGPGPAASHRSPNQWDT